MKRLIFRKAERAELVKAYDEAMAAMGLEPVQPARASALGASSGHYRLDTPHGRVECSLDVSERLAHFFCRFSDVEKGRAFVSSRPRYYTSNINRHSGKWNDYAVPHDSNDRMFAALLTLESFAHAVAEMTEQVPA